MSKHFLLSRSVLGGLLALLSGVLQGFDIQLEERDTQFLLDSFEQGVAIIGGIMAIYGRINARKQLHR